MNRHLGFGAGAVAILVWFNTAELAPVVRIWTTVLLAVLPPLLILQGRELAALQPLPKRAAYVSSIVSLWVLAGITAVVAGFAGLDAAALGLAAMDTASLLAWTGGLTLAGLAVVALFHVAGFRESEITRQLIPVSAGEKGWFVGVSITAGVCEEFVFRGFLIYTLHAASGSVPLAVVVSSVVFGVVHAYQQPVGAIRAGVLGVLLALPLVLAGSIWPAIAAHALLDVIAGLVLARWLTR